MCLTEYDSRVRLGAFGLAMECKSQTQTMAEIESGKKKYRKFLFFIFIFIFLIFAYLLLSWLFQCFAEHGEMVRPGFDQRVLGVQVHRKHDGPRISSGSWTLTMTYGSLVIMWNRRGVCRWGKGWTRLNENFGYNVVGALHITEAKRGAFGWVHSVYSAFRIGYQVCSLFCARYSFSAIYIFSFLSFYFNQNIFYLWFFIILSIQLNNQNFGFLTPMG